MKHLFYLILEAPWYGDCIVLVQAEDSDTAARLAYGRYPDLVSRRTNQQNKDTPITFDENGVSTIIATYE